LFGSLRCLAHVNGQRGGVDEKLWIQGVFKNQSRRFLIDGSATRLTPRWAWCAAVAPSCRSAE
jgi:hypothetical protein